MANENRQITKEVFISYCTKDSDYAQYFCNLLEGNGISCWIAPRDIPSGEDWAANIVRGLKETKLVAFIVSNASVASSEVEKEIGLANSFKNEILQVRLEEAILSPAMLYHLANKQWVDALGDEKSSRFNTSLEAIRKLLNKEDLDGVIDTSVIGQARKLVDHLILKHGKILDEINATFSLMSEKGGLVYITFPLMIGANGVVITFKFDCLNKTMRVYGDAACDGDPIKDPFCNLITKYFKQIFTNTNRISGKRRWGFVEFITETSITSSLADLSVEACFEVYKTNVLAFSEKVMPMLFKWALYVKSVCDAINRLQNKLKEHFPENEGWKVGAPEGNRLVDCRIYGQLNVFKEKWAPNNNNYQGRGLLSLTLQSRGHLLNDLQIGILKYEDWNDLGEWEAIIRDKANKIIGQSDNPDNWWPWWQYLGAPWNKSGISQATFDWENDLDSFVGHCLEKFKLLKALVSEIDATCLAIPSLQDKDPDTLPLEKQKNWWTDHLYIRNRMRLISDTLKDKIGDDTISVHSIYRGGGMFNSIYLATKIEQFETAIAFRFHSQEISIAVLNLELPDFETFVTKQFIIQRFSNELMNDKIQAKQVCGGKSVIDWMNDLQAFILERAPKFIEALKSLQQHLLSVVVLTQEVTVTIIETLNQHTDGWIIDNKAVTLVPDAPINIWHKTWLKNGAKENELPPFMFQIVPTKPCFDGLIISLRQNEQLALEFAHRIGMVCGACEYAIGKSCPSGDHYGIWSAYLPEFTITGGSNFSRTLICNDEKKSLAQCIINLAGSLKKIVNIITPICIEHNFQQHFLGHIFTLREILTTELQLIFPEKEGWILSTNTKSQDRYSSIKFYKKSWVSLDQDTGTLSIAIEAQQINFNDLCYGILGYGGFNEDQKEMIRQKMNDVFGLGRKNAFWIWWQFADAIARKTGGIETSIIDEKEQKSLVGYFTEQFSKIKNEVVPLIDSMFNTTENIEQEAVLS